MKEEYQRECLPCLPALASTPDGRQLAAIFLKQPLEDRDSYRNRDVECKWTAATAGGRIEAIYLDINFKGLPERKIRICLDESLFSEELMLWFKLLVESGGNLVLNDSLDPTVPGISVSNVPLDLPEKVLAQNS